MKILVKPILLLFIFFCSIYLLVQPGHIYSSDTNPKYNVTKGIVDFHRLTIPWDINGVVRGRSEKLYCFYGIGESILFVPLYLTGKIFAHIFITLDREYVVESITSCLNAVITALTCVVLFVFGLTIGYSKKVSFSLSAIYGLGTIAVIYARDSYEHPQETLFLLLAVFCAYLYVHRENLKWLILSAVSIGFAIITRLPPIIIVPLILTYMALSKKKICPHYNIFKKI